jgi:hypothetical protein
MEFCFAMPVLLIIAGATIDLSRYMRFLQITTFVSQETASQIYRQCSDITIYKPPVLNSTGLQIDTTLTQTAVQACIERVQAGAQQLLNRSVGRAAVGAKVFRWNIGDPTVGTNCASVNTMGQNVTEIRAVANLTTTGMSDQTKSQLTEGECEEDQPNANISQVNTSPLYVQTSISDSTSSISESTLTGLIAEGVQLQGDGIYQTKNGASPDKRLLVTPSAMCQRGRVATVEVSYAFVPIVKFLPQMMITLNTDGSQRETTVL